MTKFHKSFIILIATAMVSCAGGNKKNSEDSAVATMADTMTTSIIEADTVPTDTLGGYFSDDLRKFGLLGKVKAVTTVDYSPFVTCLSGPLSFDTEGILISKFNELLDNETGCNPEGFIDETECRESDGTVFELEYTNFDSEWNPIAGKYRSEGPDQLWEVEFTIEYLDFDSERNWLKRSFKGESTTRNMNSDGEYGREQKEIFTAAESRKITYYR